MRTFAQKQKPTQGAKTASTARPGLASSGQGRSASPSPDVRGSVGNHTGERLLQGRVQEVGDESGFDGLSRVAHNFSRIPVHADALATIQQELQVDTPGHADEQQADRIAERVMGMPEPQVWRVCPCGSGCPRCQDERATERLRTKRVPPNDSEEMIAAPMVQEVLGSSGEPLDLATRAFFEPRFGFDFSRVRIHRDHDAAESARAIGAEAYTVAHHIVFGAGRYALGVADGHRLLAHELAHVMQQRAWRAPRIQSQKTQEEREQEARAKLLVDFTDGAGLPEKQVGRIAAAMRGFSLHQLRAMRKAGVRFWAPDSLPPEFKDRAAVEKLSAPGGYWHLLRLIQMAEKATTDAIRHELAHAWDHVRTGKVKPIAPVKDKDFVKALEETPPLSSETREKRATKETHEGKVRGVRLPISEMFDRYKRWRLREQSFDNPSTREGYSKTSPAEFYAEGYSVFHGGREWNQARLLYYAPELYELLEAEAKKEGLDVPDRSKIEAALKEQKLQ